MQQEDGCTGLEFWRVILADDTDFASIGIQLELNLGNKIAHVESLCLDDMRATGTILRKSNTQGTGGKESEKEKPERQEILIRGQSGQAESSVGNNSTEKSPMDYAK